jgi:hypothetical protein
MMQLTLRNISPFCRAQAYLQRFKDLEEEVTRREREVIEKREQVYLPSYAVGSAQAAHSAHHARSHPEVLLLPL